MYQCAGLAWNISSVANTKNLAALNANGKPGSNAPFSLALTVSQQVVAAPPFFGPAASRGINKPYKVSRKSSNLASSSSDNAS